MLWFIPIKGSVLRTTMILWNQQSALALGLISPQATDRVQFTAEEKRLDLYMNFPNGSRFPCSVCGQDCPVYDT